MSTLQRSVAVVVVRFALLLGLIVAPGVTYYLLGYHETDIHDPATLPDRISMCLRQWHDDPTGKTDTWAEATRDTEDPIVVDPRPFSPCPKRTCKYGPQHDACDTVLYVRVGPDACIAYALLGGP